MPDNIPDLLDGTNPPAPGDPLADLVGEGKKFKDAAALAKGKLEADVFIEQLKTENAELRKLAGKQEQTTDQSKQIETLIERIEKLSTGQTGNQPVTLTREEIAKLVKDGITTDRTEMNRKGNRAIVNAELVTGFAGDSAKAAVHLKSRLDQLGMTGDAAKELAETNPKVFRELFVPQKQTQQKNDSSLPPGRTIVPNTTEERGASFYRNLRKEIGSKYFEPAIQQARMKDAMRLGDKFNQL